VHDLATLLGPRRTTSETVLSREATARSVRRWLATGRLVRLHPGWVTLPEWAEDWTVRAHAATGYTGGVLSHGTGLRVHGLIDQEAWRLHVTVPSVERLRSTRRLRIHRSRRPCGITIAGGLATTSVARALVDAWGAAHRGRSTGRDADVARNALFRAVRERRVGVPEIEQELARVPRLPGLAALRNLLNEVGAGSHSHLELVGIRALRAAGLPEPQRQYEVVLPGGRLHVDLAWPELRLAVEFDGAAYHSGRDDWQRDLRRDAALAAAGWLVLRFSYADVTERPGRCIAQIADAYRHRAHGVPQADIRGPGMSASGTPWAT
jgi:very-short-patch-repair endonuclease